MVQKRTLGRRLVKWLAIILGSVILLLILAIILLQTPYGQKIVKNQAEKYLTKKLQTRVSVEKLTIKYLSGIQVSGVYLEDQQKKELLSIDQLDLSYDAAGLFRKYIILSNIRIKGLKLHFERDSSTEKFNYDFIPAAFASTDTTSENKNNGSGFSIHLGKISLDSILFIMDDGFGGKKYEISLPKFRTDITSSDIDKLHFHANYLLSEGLECSIISKQTGKTEEGVIDSVDVSTPMRFMADSVLIRNTSFKFKNISDNTDINTKIGDLFGWMVDYQSENLSARADMISLKDHFSEVNIKTVKTPKEEKAEFKVTAPSAFKFFVDSLSIENNHIVYNDNAYPKIGEKAIDYSHIGLDKVNLHISGLGYDGKMYSGRIHDLALVEASGFTVKQLNGSVAYSDSVIRLSRLFLKTGNNQLNLDANILVLPGKKPNEKNYGITAGISSPALHLSEALYFQPSLAANKYFAPLTNKTIRLNSTIHGKLDNLHIPQLVIREGSNRISAAADVLHLPDTKNMVINLRLKEFSSTREGILSYLPKGTIPDSLLHYIPESLSVKGEYKGSLENMYADLQLVSSDGNATIKGTLKNLSDTKKASYDLVVTTDQVDPARILEDTSMGKISVTVKAKGKGFDIKTAIADYDIHINEAVYNGYNYRQMKLKGKIDKNTIDTDINSEDPNLLLKSHVFLNLNPGQRAFKTYADIQHADLHALGFMPDSFTVKSTIEADFPLVDSNGINGNMQVTETLLTLKGKPIYIDTMQLDAARIADSQAIKFSSPFANMQLNGRYSLPDVRPAVRTIADSYFSTNAKDTVFTTDVKASFFADVHIPDSIVGLFTPATSIAPFYVIGDVDTKSNLLKLFASIPAVKNPTMIIDTVNIAFVTQDGDKKYNDMRYAISIAVLTGSSYSLKASTIQGSINRGVIDGLMRLDDDKAQPRYLIPFVYTNNPERPSITIRDSLMINTKFWSVSKDNIIYLNTDKLSGSKLSLKDRNTLIELKAADDNDQGLPVTLKIRSFNIKDIAELVITDTAMASGMLNGDANLTSFEPLNFTTNFSIDSLTLLKAKLGTLKADVAQKQSGTLDINSSLTNKESNLTLNGQYSTATKEQDLVLDVKQLDLAGVGPILREYVGDLKGRLNGNLAIKGTLEKPLIIGKLKTDSLQGIYAMTGTFFRIPEAELAFNEQGIQFNELDFLDSLGNKGKINGTIHTTDYRHLQFDLAINTDNFEVVGRKKFPQQDIYGPTNADLKLTLKGTEKTASLEGTVRINDKSLFTYIYRPSTNEELGQGLVEFFDPLKPLDTTIVKETVLKSALGFQFLTNIYVHITPESTVEIMLDEISGDHLRLKGNADLNYIMRPGGEVSLTGGYQLEGGEYDLSIAGIVRKNFKIEKGSTIYWNGDPLKGNMNITALYKIKTAAGQLVNDIEHVPGIDKQKLNFDVYIILKNELMKPDISFRLDMEEQDQEAFGGIIYTRIKQVNSIPAELNKQVMGLLAFNQFIAENPFNSFTSAGGDFQTQAFNTAGKIITEQLADLVGRYLKDVDIDFALEQEKDYTSGTEMQKTNFNVGVTKSLANNRLNVYVGSSFALEGANQDEGALDGLAGDVTLEYLLTPDGRYRLKGYRLTDNDLTFQGNVVRTGVSFVLVLEFNKFKNAFKKPRRQKT